MMRKNSLLLFILFFLVGLLYLTSCSKTSDNIEVRLKEVINGESGESSAPVETSVSKVQSSSPHDQIVEYDKFTQEISFPESEFPSWFPADVPIYPVGKVYIAYLEQEIFYLMLVVPHLSDQVIEFFNREIPNMGWSLRIDPLDRSNQPYLNQKLVGFKDNRKIEVVISWNENSPKITRFTMRIGPSDADLTQYDCRECY